MSEHKVLEEVLCNSVYSIDFIVSDTFNLATAESETVSGYDLGMILPLIKKYGHNAIVAYVSIKRKKEPLSCCNHRNESYYSAKEEMLRFMEDDEQFTKPW